MNKSVFISYAHEDSTLLPSVQKILREKGILTPSQGIVDDPQQDLKLGDNIRELLTEKIKSASVVVVIDSKNSQKSQWVNYEIGLAMALDKPIIVVGKKGSWNTKSIISSIENAQKVEIDNVPS